MIGLSSSVYRVSPGVTDAELSRAAGKAIAFERTPSGLVVHWWWFSRRAIPWLAGFLMSGCITLGMVVDVGQIVDAPKYAIPLAFWTACTLTCAYFVFGYLMNRTQVIVDRKKIEVRHGPIPWRGGKVVRLDDLAQLFVAHAREVDGVTRPSRTGEIHVMARTIEGEDIVLVNGPLRSERASAIEATLEAYLHVEDAPLQRS